MNQYHSAVYADIQAIRNSAPLIHNITNFVVMQQTANALLAVGASPIMAHAEDEIANIVQLTNALVINIGTLDSIWVNAMAQAMQVAKQRSIPIILDPVGAGATPYRTQTVHNLITIASPTVIRGNASEILALASNLQATKGVDSTHGSEVAFEAAMQLAKKHNNVITVSGAVDLCIAPQQQIRIYNGVPLMTKVTGMGCTATALIGAFCAVNSNFLHAAAHAMAVMGIAGEIAAEKAMGPGSLLIQFLDALYNLSVTDIKTRLRLEYF